MLFHHLSPDLSLILATVGLCLIFLELNRPGLIVPGALGLLLILLAAAELLQDRLRPWAVALLAASAATVAFNLYRKVPVWLLGATTVAVIISMRFLVQGSTAPIHTSVAVACGVLVGVLSATLSRIALRARRAKAIH